jgi:integrase
VTTLQGIPVLRLTDEQGTLKNRFSRRDVPIHPATMGIIDYAKAREGPWLFPSLPMWSSTGYRRGAAFQRVATDFMRKRLKITDKRLTMHSLRHTWRDLARAVEMPLDVSAAIMGHTLGKGEHAAYGVGPSLPKLAKWIAKIDPLA